MEDLLLTTAILNTIEEWQKMKAANAQRETRILSDLLGVLFVQSLLPHDKRMSFKRLVREVQKVH